MSSAVHTFVQPITEPLDGLHSHFTQLAAKHRDANDLLRSHANDLLASGSSNGFTGDGATAFSGLVNYYVDTSEKHAQALDDAANTVYTCHSSIMDATDTASSAGLHESLTHKVLTKVTHNDIIQNGGDSIQAVVSDLMSTLSDMKNTAGGFFGNVFSGNFGAAWGDIGQEFSDAGQLVSDVSGLLQDIGKVLGQWASTISDVVGKCLKFIGTALWDVVDFVFDFSGIINDVKTLFDPKKSLWDKILAGGDLILNVGMDVLMVTGIGETLRAGELLLKGAVDIGEKLLEDGGKQLLMDAAKSIVQFFKDAAEQVTKKLLKRLFSGAAREGADIFVNIFKGDGTRLLDKVIDLDADGVFKSLDPQLQDLVTKVQQITGEQVSKLEDMTRQVMNRGGMAVEDMDIYKDAGPKLQKYFDRIARSPMAKNWRAAYGSAVEEMSWDEMKAQGLDRAFGLEYNKTAPSALQWLTSTTKRGARPDVLQSLADDMWNGLDWTSENYDGKIAEKYTSNQIEYLIEYLYKAPPVPVP